MILCIGLAADNTFIHTLLALKKAGIAFDVIDLVQLAYSGEIDIQLHDLLSSKLKLHHKQFTLDRYSGIWIRLLDISSGAPTQELKERVSGLYLALSRLFSTVSLRVINPPLRGSSNFSKLFHSVDLASITGWKVPRSCLTNNIDAARNFIESSKTGVVFKGASGVKTWATLYDQNKHESKLNLIKVCPVLFQERIDGPDVRIHAVGDHVFGEMIDSPEIDYRTVRRNIYSTIELPYNISIGCRALINSCGLPFLGIDFKIRKSTGEWFFLEANSLPSYQGYDRRCHGAISKAIVNWLINE